MVVDNNMRIMIARSAVVGIYVKAMSRFGTLMITLQTPYINPRYITTKRGLHP